VTSFGRLTFALGAALAHALELPNKIGLSREHYFIMQRAYSTTIGQQLMDLEESYKKGLITERLHR
jgi:hypothetical protein